MFEHELVLLYNAIIFYCLFTESANAKNSVDLLHERTSENHFLNYHWLYPNININEPITASVILITTLMRAH
jgi:hypothetical protein